MSVTEVNEIGLHVRGSERSNDGTSKHRTAAAAAAAAAAGSLNCKQQVDVLAKAAGVVVSQSARVAEGFENGVGLRSTFRGLGCDSGVEKLPGAHGW